jgi:hypothetical protein
LTTTTGEQSTTVDWTVLDDPAVAGVAHSAAAKVARQYPTTTEYDDLHQDARLLLATDATTVRAYLDDPDKGVRLLHHRLWRDLIDSIKTDAQHRSQHLSYERIRESTAA